MVQNVLKPLESDLLHHNVRAYLDCIARCNSYDPSSLLPFEIDEKIIGYITKGLFKHLSQKFGDTFLLKNEVIRFSSSLTGFEERTDFFDSVISTLLSEGLIETPHDEYYAVMENFGDAPLFKIKRGATAYFGFKNYGIHVNAYVRRPDGLYMWIAKRSSKKIVAPGKLDQLVAGGQSYGLTVQANLLKEAYEEAGLSREDLSKAVSTGVLRYKRQTGFKYRRDFIFTYDVELAPDIEPENKDGEVESFHLLSLRQVIDFLAAPDDFKFNSALVVIDFLIRHGIITPDEKDYFLLTQKLYA